MSGIYIPGIKMPKDEEMLCVDIYPNGKVCINLDLKCKRIATAIPVPEHGRLIDADAVTSAAMEDILQWEDAGCDRDDYRAFLDNYIEDAPTIIPSDKEGEG